VHVDKTENIAQVALVGAPNVGKSSLVALLSSGAPEVCDYPFTTRSISMGHFFVSGRRHQVRCSLLDMVMGVDRIDVTCLHSQHMSRRHPLLRDLLDFTSSVTATRGTKSLVVHSMHPIFCRTTSISGQCRWVQLRCIR